MTSVPLALRTKLGDGASMALAEMLSEREDVWSEQVMHLAIERFERRLTEVVAPVRIDLAQMESHLMKWSFLFWISQVATLAGLVALLLRTKS